MLADKATGHRRRRTSQQSEKIVDVEVFEMAVEKDKSQKVSLPELIKQVMVIVDAGGEAKAVLEAQVKALTQSLEKERQQKFLLAELAQIRASMDNMMAMLNRALPAAKTAMVADGNPKNAAGKDESSN